MSLWRGSTARWSATSLGVGLLLLGYTYAVVVTAWVHEDSYITHRTIDNFLAGYGLRWNIAERVQTYTHPLWLFLLTPFVYLTGTAYFSTIAVSIAASLLAVWTLVFRIARSGLHAAISLALLIGSSAYLDYSTSGLENPLTHALLAAFLAVHFAGVASPKRLLLLSFIGGLGVLNRMDTALLFAPILLLHCVEHRNWETLRMLALGFLPLILWECFSLFYYGVPFPNTAYAKLNHDVARLDMIAFGARYLVYSALHDPVTIVTLIAAFCFGSASGTRREALPVVVGMGLYLLYVVWIGAGYMAGRFLSALVFCGAAIVARQDFSGSGVRTLALPAAIALLALAAPRVLPLLPNPFPIHDEQRTYHVFAGLTNWKPGEIWPASPLMLSGIEHRKNKRKVLLTGGIGFRAYAAGPGTHVIDRYGLSDPLIARIAVIDKKAWMPGHFSRAAPPGYLKTQRVGENKIEHPQLAEFYEKIALITRGPLLSSERLKAIVLLNLGHYDHWVRSYEATLKSTAPHVPESL